MNNTNLNLPIQGSAPYLPPESKAVSSGEINPEEKERIIRIFKDNINLKNKTLSKTRFTKYCIKFLGNKPLDRIKVFIDCGEYKSAALLINALSGEAQVFENSTKLLPRKGIAFLIQELASYRKGDLICSLIQNNPENLLRLLQVASFPIFNKKDKAFLLELGEKLGKEDLFQEICNLHDEGIYPNFYNLPFERFNEASISFIKLLIDHKVPFDDTMIQASIFSYNYPYIELILQHTAQPVLEGMKDWILKSLMKMEDPKLFELFLNKMPTLAKGCSQELLLEAVSSGRSRFVSWVLQNGYDMSSQEAQSLLDSAIQLGSLPLIKLLHPLTSLSIPYQDLLGFGDTLTKEKQDLKLFQLALFSSVEDLYALAILKPQTTNSLDSVLSKLALLVRFPSLDSSKELSTLGSSAKAYAESSWEYAKGNEAFILKNTSRIKRKSLISKVITDRVARFPNLSIEYKTERHPNKQYNTPTVVGQTMPKESGFTNDIANTLRYSWCLRHLNPHFITSSTSIQIERDGSLQYFYEYQDKDKLHKLPTTKLSNTLQMMVHTPKQTIESLERHLESLHKEIVLFPLDLQNKENTKQFFEKVVRGYWLIATLCEMERGTPHNAMMWLNYVYNQHHLPSPIPKIDHFFLDNTMIVLPLEKAIEDWESFFEPPLDKTVSREDLMTLLSQDGMLLKQCSPEIRNDKECVEIALKQNSKAYVFAEKKFHPSKTK